MSKKQMPTSTLSRSVTAAQTIAKAGGKSLKFLAKRPFLNEQEKVQEQNAAHAEIGQAVFEGLSKLRGTALKIAQMLSLETNVLPPQLREQLSRSHYQVPPLNKALVRQVVEAAFGERLEKVFATFELDAFAAASLGQVHRATLPDGTDVVVKVQYPGIKEAIKADVALVRTFFMPLGAKLLPKAYLEKVIQEIAVRLDEETDYEREAEQTAIFARMNTYAEIVIPRVFPAYTRKNVLVTEFLEGKHLQDWLKDKPAQSMINRAGQAISDFNMSCLMDGDRLHADPNPGNYIFMPDGRIGLIDFGCIKIFHDKATHESIKFTLHAMFSQDRDSIFEAYRRLGVDMSHPKVPEVFEGYLLPFARLFARLAEHETFDFKANGDFAKEIGRNLMKVLQCSELLEGFTSDTVFLDRNNYGIFRILDALGAEISYHDRLYLGASSL